MTSLTLPTTQARPVLGWLAILGGTASAVAGAIQLILPSDTDPLINANEHVVLTLLAVAFVAWIPGYLTLGTSAGKLGKAAGILAALGCALLTIGMTSTNLHGQDYAWFGVVAVPANLAWLVGSVLLAVATWRTRTLPRWLSIGVALVWVTSIILSQLGGNLIAGVIWCTLGALLTRANRS
ncbi:hypothetical protein KZZ52_00900 [Dactylosporangium sp. AC04546]|uniref:hypothetical protein n=1 Tax=Dactylosporangium sp. AC04546 TaxID=2862460 RepID=UPI001EDF9D62|nr:hypothetical protein [Dactylosporangium sp. AC04546]WVK84039.1 hypothetical protein KZZ52_00900 [Dactylosporangium sp. AC04546]